MEVASIDRGRVTLVLDLDELRLVKNALNEVAHGRHFDDRQFRTRLGAEREEAVRLLAAVHGALDAAEEFGR